MLMLEQNFLPKEHLHIEALQFLSQKWPPEIRTKVGLVITQVLILFCMSLMGLGLMWVCERSQRNWG